MFHLGHAHGTFANFIGERHGRVADEEQDSVGVQAEAAQQIGGGRLLPKAAPPWLLYDLGIDRFSFLYLRIVHGAENRHIIGGDRALLTPRRSANAVGTEQ